MLTPEWIDATLPLFAAGEVDALEWSFDTGWARPLPEWAARLLDTYAGVDALYGHGVHLSPLSARWTPRQAAWIERARIEASERRYVHVSEHFGWSTAGPFARGAPMPLPRSEASLRVGRDRLCRLADAIGRPVGLENLALAMCRRDVEALPDFLDALLEPVDGFVLLDLHNLYCQAANQALDAHALLERYPRHRVRELHVSGGRWATAAGRPFRRDTHDDAIPEAVIDLLTDALERFEVEVVTVERLGDTLASAEHRNAHAREVRRVRALAHARTTPPARQPLAAPPPSAVFDDPLLAEAQAAWLLELFDGAEPRRGVLAEWLDGADPAALETAAVLAERWLVRA